MSLENTLREMLNEMKKKPLDPTVHTNPERKSVSPTVHTGSQKPSEITPTSASTKMRGSGTFYNRPSQAARIAAMAPRDEGGRRRTDLQETLVEYYKRRLDEKKVDRSEVAGTIQQRVTRQGTAAGVDPSLVGLAARLARKQGTAGQSGTRVHQSEMKRSEYLKRGAEGKFYGADSPSGAQGWPATVAIRKGLVDQRFIDRARDLGLPREASKLMQNKELAHFASRPEFGGHGLSRRERGIMAGREAISRRRRASARRKLASKKGAAFPARGQGQQFDTKLLDRLIREREAGQRADTKLLDRLIREKH